MKYRVKSKEQIKKWLKENGYKKCDGFWEHDHFVPFVKPMFEFCGEKPSILWVWLPDWLEEVEEEKPKLTHEQVFDLWFEMPFITGLRSTWCKVSSFSGYIYFFITFVDGVLEQRGFSLERLQQLPHAKIPPRGVK